jgi:hypothetical protein
MGDLGFHIIFIPLRIGWEPRTVSADLQNIAEIRPDGKGGTASSAIWDNAVLTCRTSDPPTGEDFPLVLQMKRMAPWQTSTWFVERYGTAGSACYTTHDPKALFSVKKTGQDPKDLADGIGGKGSLSKAKRLSATEGTEEAIWRDGAVGWQPSPLV